MDLFHEEEQILKNAKIHLEAVRAGEPFAIEEFETIIYEYRSMLKQLRRAIRISDQTTADLNESNIDLTDKVHFDALTGIYNRRFMEDSLNRVMKTLARSNGCLSLLMIDVDFFKKYNDTYGHSEGDDCLKIVAQTLAGTLSRDDDIVARYGGEEFAVILPNTDESGARFLAGKMLENVRNKNIRHEKNDAAGYVTISIGVTTSCVDRMQTPFDYVKQADKALYKSKEDGRNRYTFMSIEEETG